MLNLSSIIISTQNPKPLTKFYEEVFEKEVDEMMGWIVGGVSVIVMEHSEVKGTAKEPARIMFNLETDNVKEEFERIKKIEGTKVIKEPYTMEGWEDFWIATLADPDGNYFQLMSPWEGDMNNKN